MPHKKFRCPIYGVTVFLVWGEFEVLRRFLLKHFNLIADEKIPELGSVASEIHPKTGVTQFIIYTVNKSYKKNSTKDEIQVHETFHLVKRIFDWIGIGLCDDSEEAWSHYQEYWYKIFKETLKKGG